MEGQRLTLDGDYGGAAAAYSEALKTYPNDEEIMLELALALALGSEAAGLERAASLCERILSGSPGAQVQYTARAALCYIYLKTGKKEEAVRAAQILPHMRVCRDTVLDEINGDPGEDEINASLSRITFRENSAYDVLVIDFSIEMLPMVKEYDLLGKIGEVRSSAGNGKSGRSMLPSVRVRDNIELPPGYVRVRYYADYLLDRAYPDPSEAAGAVIEVLRGIAGLAP